jgi:uncharacterized protein YifE (UPF0438 family)
MKGRARQASEKTGGDSKLSSASLMEQHASAFKAFDASEQNAVAEDGAHIQVAGRYILA